MKLSPLVLGSLAALALLPLLMITAGHAQENDPNPLAAYRGHKRVLLLFAPTEQNAAYRGQRKLWKGDEASFKERQLVVLPLLADSKSDIPAALAKRFDVDPQSFAVILIGKDGHNAFQSKEPVTAESLYRRIDAMPMRRAEMKQQENKQ